jgi:hypothetical protein
MQASLSSGGGNGTWIGSPGPWMGSVGSSMGFSFFIFSDGLTEAGNRSLCINKGL